jgi:hypothetical protein
MLELNNLIINNFPKYSTQILNLANQNSQATRPKNVGQLSELFIEFKNENDDRSIENWENWYKSKHPNAIEKSKEKIKEQLKNLKKSINQINDSIIENWLHDLIITKTYTGLFLQGVILKKLSKIKNKDFRLSTSFEESKGIDGYVGNIPYSIKPTTYKTKKDLKENIEATFIFYEKKKSGTIEFYVDE